MKTGTLYIVGTPIGNLEDMSPRAVRILKEVSLIAAEDTRHTRKLLSHFSIHTRLESYHKFSEKKKAARFIEILQSGKDIALVSNAGMPAISDPGEILAKEAASRNLSVVPVPGPSAFILALAASGLSTERFSFEGFLPQKQSLRRKTLYSLKEEKRTMIFYETGPRLKDSLLDMQKIFGERNMVIARELTKKFEEIIRGKQSEILFKLSNTAIKGELVIVIEGASVKRQVLRKSLKEEVESLEKELGVTKKEAIKLIAAQYDIPKREVYESAHGIK